MIPVEGHHGSPTSPIRRHDSRHEARHEEESSRRYATRSPTSPAQPNLSQLTQSNSTDSDTDTSLHTHTNRGHKLHHRAKYIRSGRLDTTGNLSHRKKITHAGYARHIIAPKPALYDEDGHPYSPIDSEDERAAAPNEDDAFGDVQLEQLLRPLTSVAELPDHPSLSVAYKSKALTQMAEQAAEMVRREREVLWKAKRLLTRLRGDADWVPCELFEGQGDEGVLFGEEVEGGEVPSLHTDMSGPDGGVAEEEKEYGDAHADVVMENVRDQAERMDGVDAMDMAVQLQAAEVGEGDKDLVLRNDDDDAQEHANTNGDVPPTNLTHDQLTIPHTTEPEPLNNTALTSLRNNDPSQPPSEQTSTSGKEPSNHPSHSMTTRARARSPDLAPASPTPSSSSSIPEINPWFLLPPTTLPDRDLGLPPTEAEETRTHLHAYVQKQEQIVRSLLTLSTGLQRADRLRKEVLRAAKASAHLRDDGRGNFVTEMSDGEDWYDVEEWGLGRAELKLLRDGTWGLEKGKEEVEDAEEEGRRGGRRRRVHRM